MNSKFLQQRGNSMKKLEEAEENNEVDQEILPLLNLINSLKDFYTTSSCYGRISLLHDVGSKKDSGWVGKWHREVEFGEVLLALEKKPDDGIVWLKYEPAILHVVARDPEGAIKILTAARNTGFKKVGIIAMKKDRNMIEVCSTERMDVPIIQDGTLLVDTGYIKYLVETANKQFKKGNKKLKRLEKGLRETLS